MKFVLIRPGTFRMGSPEGEVGRAPVGEDLHTVEITQPYYLGVYEVTQGQYEAVMKKNPSEFKAGSRYPVERVSWYDAVEFCERLSRLPDEATARRKYRLPRESEWEFACRAATSTRFSFGNTLSPEQANFDAGPDGDSPNRTTEVGSHGVNNRNAWGLSDMHGNVREWCDDWYDPAYYGQPRWLIPGPLLLAAGNWGLLGAPPEGEPFRTLSALDPARTGNPRGPAKPTNEKVLRGGCWSYSAAKCRSGARDRADPQTRDPDNGFRVLLEP
jgi:formylglycine-generating enzyme required for sulfatase activity